MAFKQQFMGIMDILTDPVTRTATWTCLALSFFNSMTGIQVLALAFHEHSSEITICNNEKDRWKDASMRAEFEFLNKHKKEFYIGFSFVGAFVANFIVAKYNHLTVLIGCHVIMGGLLISTGLFIHDCDEL